jgi:hypothetical protein
VVKDGTLTFTANQLGPSSSSIPEHHLVMRCLLAAGSAYCMYVHGESVVYDSLAELPYQRTLWVQRTVE